MTITSFAITLYSQCCRRHLWATSEVSVIIRSCWIICSLRSESNNINLLLHLFIAVLGASICFTNSVALQHGCVYLVTIDRELSDIAAPYLYVTYYYISYIFQYFQLLLLLLYLFDFMLLPLSLYLSVKLW